MSKPQSNNEQKSTSTKKNEQEVISYRALEDCRVGGMFRRKGDVFSLPDTVLPFLERITDSASAEEKPTKSPSCVTKEDLGLGKPKPSATLTSSDMIKK